MRHLLEGLRDGRSCVVVTFLLTPIYESESLLLVRFGREYVYTRKWETRR
jgi:uncharacterized protein involved in exopolysaccharide biosynthesis